MKNRCSVGGARDFRTESFVLIYVTVDGVESV